MMTTLSRPAVDSTKARRAKAALGTRTTRETIHKALDLAVAWEELTDARPLAFRGAREHNLKNISVEISLYQTLPG